MLLQEDSVESKTDASRRNIGQGRRGGGETGRLQSEQGIEIIKKIGELKSLTPTRWRLPPVDDDDLR